MAKKATAKGTLLSHMLTSGTDANQLALMRYLLAQQQPTTFTVPAVQDIGSGISAGVANISNAVMQNRAMKRQQQFMDQMLAMEGNKAQQAQLAAQERAQGLSNALGIPYDVAASGESSIINEAAKQAAETRKTEGITSDLMSAGVGKGGVMNLDAARIMAQDPTSRARYVQAVTAPNVAAISNNLQAGLGNPATAEGQNNYEAGFGIKPTTPYETDKQFYDSRNAGYQAEGSKRVLPYLAPQASANLASTMIGNKGKTLENQNQATTNQYQPGLLQSQLQGSNITNAQNNFNLTNDQARLQLIQDAIKNNSYGDPSAFGINSMRWQGLGGTGNPFYPGMQFQLDLTAPKTGEAAKNLNNFGKVNEQVGTQTNPIPVPQAPPIQAPPATPQPILSPVQQGEQTRNNLINGTVGAAQSFGNGALDFGQGYLNFGKNIQGFTGLPFNPTDMFGTGQNGINQLRGR